MEDIPPQVDEWEQFDENAHDPFHSAEHLYEDNAPYTTKKARMSEAYLNALKNKRYATKVPKPFVPVKPWGGTGRKGNFRRDPFVSWRNNTVKTKPANWTRWSEETGKSTLMSAHSWVVLLREKIPNIRRVSKAGQSLLAGWLDEGIEEALEKARSVYATAGVRTDTFGHSRHIAVAQGNPQFNKSMNTAMPPHLQEMLATRSAKARTRIARLNELRPGWQNARHAYTMLHPLWKRIWKTVKIAAKAGGFGSKLKATTPFGVVFNKEEVRNMILAQFNMPAEIYRKYLLNNQNAMGLITPDHQIRMPSIEFLIANAQFLDITGYMTICAAAYKASGEQKEASSGPSMRMIQEATAKFGTYTAVSRGMRKLRNLYLKKAKDVTDQQKSQLYRGWVWGFLIGDDTKGIGNDTFVSMQRAAEFLKRVHGYSEYGPRIGDALRYVAKPIGDAMG